jgi:hypothetical protein
MKIGMSMATPKAKLPLELLISCRQQQQRDTHVSTAILPALYVLYTDEIFFAIKMCKF